ncbi:MAG: hypothetical protein HKO65_07985 [Gemmatimonadetes bacterium]|nr:hypothetical protein [Gemmatimonadota bacterium]NNM05030.1 hypothetical protein [Gemmatimonadota bacterium]
MVTLPRTLVFLGLTLLLSGCAALQNPLRSNRTDGGIRNEGGATIISGRALDEQRGTLLDTMEGRVPGMNVLRHVDQCPQVSLRSHVTFHSVVNPYVYVDGTRAIDTCILDMLTTDNVESIEIYPTGVTKRPGYSTHAHGLILVFSRGATL